MQASLFVAQARGWDWRGRPAGHGPRIVAQAISSAARPAAGEIKRTERDAIGKALQPALQIVPGHAARRSALAIRTGIENCHSSRKTTSRVRAPNTLRMPISRVRRLGGESRQPEQAQTGDEDGDGDKDAEHRALLLVGLIKPVEAVVQEMAIDGDVGREPPPGAIHEGHRIGNLSRPRCAPKRNWNPSGHSDRWWAAPAGARRRSGHPQTPRRCAHGLCRQQNGLADRLRGGEAEIAAPPPRLIRMLWPSFLGGMSARRSASSPRSSDSRRARPPAACHTREDTPA